MCNTHGGRAPQVRRRAQQRLDESADVAVVRIVAIMNDRSLPATVRLSAAKEVLDRAGLTGPKRVDVSVTMQPWEDRLNEIIVDYGSDDEDDVVEAEIVPDEPPRRKRRR